ncbi:hypothetical protein PPTG_21764 [Phytophthora nicotianae INRA-310]|uniref:Uncharacterized protein n=2 Tax=Phytophthora nicotianae TaxID=4792 RepID=W2QUD5_PHYN3|nr:hypothetical protein PPTG_21764 [Phytophthora nicotianae INRA-310]ETN16718.1 hypothetical protein PPTG_21764 [Phytophthora nicotianae INRA-310]
MTIWRATQSRIQEQLPLVVDFLRSRKVSAGPATTLYMATTQARHPSDVPLEVPTSSTFQQLHEAYPTIWIVLHKVEAPIPVNIGDLRRILGLPDWNLRLPFRQPNREPVGSPLSESADIEDEEHKNEEGLLFESIGFALTEHFHVRACEVAPGYYGSSTGIILDDDKDNSVWTPPRLNYLAENQDGDLSMTDNEKDLLGVASCCISR